MKFKHQVVAALAAVALLATGLVVHDSQISVAGSIRQPIPSLAQKQALVARTTGKPPVPYVPEKQALALRLTGDCALYGSGCLGDWTTKQHGVDGDAATADVLVAGDSIVNRCRPYLRKRLLAQGLTVVFDYWSSRPTEPTVTRVLSYSRLYSPEPFKAVAMGTGTNDIFDPPEMAAQLVRMQGLELRLLWGTVYSARSGTYSADLRNAGWVNGQIHAAGIPTIDWFAFLASYPGYRIPNYIADGTHPTYDPTEPQLGDGTGCDAWASIYTSKIVMEAKRK